MKATPIITPQTWGESNIKDMVNRIISRLGKSDLEYLYDILKHKKDTAQFLATLTHDIPPRLGWPEGEF